MHVLANRFWSWYERHYIFNLLLAAGLFLLQLIHLYWMTAHVLLLELTGRSFFPGGPLTEPLLAAIDYTEIPALISTSLLYVNDLRKQFRWREVLFLLFIHSQWLHLFWITDEFIVEQFLGNPRETILPYWLAWVALSIDYLEVPVIVDTVRRAMIVLRREGVQATLRKASRTTLRSRFLPR